MNARILDLINNPETIQNQDLELLNIEVKKNPYLQSIRALQLFGIHKYNPESYQKALSTTAAYTTDKKILYQFINKNTPKEFMEPFSVEIEKLEVADHQKETISPIQNEIPDVISNDFNEVSDSETKKIDVHRALNRILFEGEEDFLERKNEVIDLDATLESGSIVTQKSEIETTKSYLETEKIINSEDSKSEIIEVFTEETIINSSEIANEEEIVENQSELSFHGMEDFLPEVKITPNISQSTLYEVPKQNINKHEEEMQRLIAEVEAKMKTSKKEKLQEEESIQNNDLNFFETQTFEIETPKGKNSVPEKPKEAVIEQEEISIKAPEKHQKTTENKQISVEIEEKPSISENSEWKPMSFSNNIPDALIEKKPEAKEIEKEILPEKESVAESSINEEKADERPVFNVSFFTPKVSTIDAEQTKISEEKSSDLPKNDQSLENSNVPIFINTWQNWLKIDRNEAKKEEKTPISKEKVIEEFIIKEPKISKLKEDSDFIVKEKGDNISHLMTETLAKLYIEQKLYAKAIKAYQVLTEKHPEKTSYFEDKIKQIKELRQNK